VPEVFCLDVPEASSRELFVAASVQIAAIVATTRGGCRLAMTCFVENFASLADKKFNRGLPDTVFLPLNKPGIRDGKYICRICSTYALPMSAGYAYPVRSIRINRYP